jgi:hypothetical protein
LPNDALRNPVCLRRPHLFLMNWRPGQAHSPNPVKSAPIREICGDPCRWWGNFNKESKKAGREFFLPSGFPY